MELDSPRYLDHEVPTKNAKSEGKRRSIKKTRNHQQHEKKMLSPSTHRWTPGQRRSRSCWSSSVQAILPPVDLDSIFFPDGATRADYTNIVGSHQVRKALMNTNSSGERLRNAIKTDLIENHDIEFPESSIRWKSEMTLRRILGLNHQNNEADLVHTILHKLYPTTEEKAWWWNIRGRHGDSQQGFRYGR